MSIPASFLAQAENHGCFSGCFGHEARFAVCLDPYRPAEEIIAVYCKDCNSFRIGLLKSLAPPNSSPALVADLLTAHTRRQRGFAWSFSGYHAVGPGFWLTAAYYANCGLFLLNGARSRSVGSDLDLLMLAFQYGIAAPSHPHMTDARAYNVRECYVDFSSPPGLIHSPQSFYSSPQCSFQPTRGYQRVTAAEFQPLSRKAFPSPQTLGAAAAPVGRQAAAPVGKSTPPPSIADAPEIGNICPICQAEIRERPLFTGSYIGCLCDI